MIALLAWLSLVGCGGDCTEVGEVCLVAGLGEPAFGTPGLARETGLYWPSDVTVDPNGDLWIIDWNNHRFLRTQGEGREATLDLIAGSGLIGDGPLDGTVSGSRWNHPSSVTFREDGVAVVAAWHNSRVVAFDLEADQVSHIAGNGERAFSGDEGPAVEAAFDLPSGVAFGADGLLYVTDQANQRVRCIDGEQVIRTVVGNGEPRFAGDGGPASEASLRMEVSQNADPGGRIVIVDQKLYIADTLNHAIRVVDLDSGVIDTLIGSGGRADSGDGPRQVSLFFPRDVAMGPDGDLFVADSENHCVRRLREGRMETVLGTCGEEGQGAPRGNPAKVLLNKPMGIDVGPDGALYVADSWNHRILRVNP